MIKDEYYSYKMELGQGSFGVVYLFESDTGKKVAVKTFKQGATKFLNMAILTESKM
jgi:RIO-like serine/threonine protein kinase